MPVELKWGLIIVVAGFLWVLLEWAVGLHGPLIAYHPIVTMLWIPLAIVLLVLGLRDKKRRQGSLSYVQGLLSTALIALVIALLSPVTQWLYLGVINPGFFETMIDAAVARGTARSEAVAYFNLGNYLLMATVSGVVGTLVSGAIAMIFLRSRA